MYTVTVTPVLYVSRGIDRFNDCILFRFTKSNDKHDFITGMNVKYFAQFLTVDRSDNTTAQFLLCCTEKNTLCSDAMVTSEGIANFSVFQNNNVRRRSFAFRWTGPVGKIACPCKSGKNPCILPGIAREDLLKGLLVSSRGTQTGKVDQFSQRLKTYGNIFIESPITPVFSNQILYHLLSSFQ